jgi:hypothetical protein
MQSCYGCARVANSPVFPGMSRMSAYICPASRLYGRPGTLNVLFFSRTVIITVKVMQNLHDRVIAMSGRADRRNIGRWYEAKLCLVTYVIWDITEVNSISVH